MINNEFSYKGSKVTVVFSGAAGWFDIYINGSPRACDRAAKVYARAKQIIDREGK